MLKINKLAFHYADNFLFKSLSFTVNSGDALQVIGQNGAGKTTLLKLLAGLLTPESGDIKSVGTMTYSKRCYIGHQYGVNQKLTPREHLAYDLGVINKTEQHQYLSKFALDDVADNPCGLLSAGEKRRVSLLSLLTIPADIWLLDEPFVALDTTGVALLGALMQNKLALGGIVIFTSHQALPFELPTLQVLSL